MSHFEKMQFLFEWGFAYLSTGLVLLSAIGLIVFVSTFVYIRMKK
jgi:hypothetical protein